MGRRISDRIARAGYIFNLLHLVNETRRVYEPLWCAPNIFPNCLQVWENPFDHPLERTKQNRRGSVLVCRVTIYVSTYRAEAGRLAF